MNREETSMRCWAEIDLAQLAHNFQEIRSSLPEDCRTFGVVKADAYGHGAVPVARELLRQGCGALAVAALSEAQQLRDGGISCPILCLGHIAPEEAVHASEISMIQAVGDLETARAFAENLRRAGKKLDIHLKLDTGMGRLGFRAEEQDALRDALEVLRMPEFEVKGVFTHFAVADEADGGEYTRRQYRSFCSAVSALEKNWGKMFPVRHCANSAAVINYPEMHLDAARPGIILYGQYPGPEKTRLSLRPVMQLRVRVAAVTHHKAGDTISYGRRFCAQRDTDLAVLSIGYADGLHRTMSGKLEVLLHGRRVRQVGSICMDMCMVDVTDVPGVHPGDTATIIGCDGDGCVDADELASWAGTISYEIFCSVSKRVPRIYLNASRE